MQVRIRLFASMAEAAGIREIAVELPAPAVATDAFDAVAARHPKLAPFRERALYAVNAAYAGPLTPLAEGDEVALIPPVSGGAGCS